MINKICLTGKHLRFHSGGDVFAFMPLIIMLYLFKEAKASCACDAGWEAFYGGTITVFRRLVAAGDSPTGMDTSYRFNPIWVKPSVTVF